MIQINSNTIGNSAPIEEWIEAMENAFRDTDAGVVEVPHRTHFNRGENSLLLMPCFGENYFSTKMVAVYPKNLMNHKPVINGTVILNEGKTGVPLAVLDGNKLTAMRTAAVGSVGIKYLAPEDADTLGIIGLGIQGFHQALFACYQRPIKELRIMDRSKAIMERFKERFNAYYEDVRVIPCWSATELCNASRIIITATGSRHPVVPGKGGWWKGKTMIGIGSYKPEMREFPDEIMGDLERIYVDTHHGLDESGDLLGPLKSRIVTRDQISPLADLVTGKESRQGETQFFKSVGMAAFDLYGAVLVYENLA